MKAYKYKLKPSAKIIAIFESWLALLCELYNAALQERRDAYRINHLSINYKAQANQLPEIKKDRPEFARIHSQVIQNALKRVDFAFDDFFRRVKEGQKPGYPRFRSSSRYDSFTYPQSGFSLKGKKLHLSKIGKVKLQSLAPDRRRDQDLYDQTRGRWLVCDLRGRRAEEGSRAGAERECRGGCRD